MHSVMITFEQKGKGTICFWREIWPRCASAFLAMILLVHMELIFSKNMRSYSHKQLWLWTFFLLIIKCKKVPIHVHHNRFSLSFHMSRYFGVWFLSSKYFSHASPSSGSFQHLIISIGEHALKVASTTQAWCYFFHLQCSCLYSHSSLKAHSVRCSSGSLSFMVACPITPIRSALSPSTPLWVLHSWHC